MGEEKEEIEERIDNKDDTAVKVLDHPITYNEVHAMELGLVGVFAGMGYGVGMENEALMLSGILMLVAFGMESIKLGDSLEPNMAIATKQHEPWYFTCSYILSFGTGLILAGVL